MNEEPKRPERIFRYYSQYHSDVFTEKKLWFSSVSEFNDIFEVIPRFDTLVPQLLKQAIPKAYALLPPTHNESYLHFEKRILNTPKFVDNLIETYTDGFQAKISSNYGFLCFTEHLDSLLMWGHYTNCHRGFVIEFDPKHPLFLPEDFGRVIYEKDMPILSLDADSQMLLRKSPEWKYEDEHRLIKPIMDLTSGRKKRGGKEVEGYFLPLPMEAVKAVYLGCRISEDDRKKLIEPLDGFPMIKRFCMRRNRIEYKLDQIPFNEWKELRKIGAD